MDSWESCQRSAARYLADNVELRGLVGASPHDEFTLHPLGEGEHNVNFWFSVPDGAASRLPEPKKASSKSASQRYVLRVNVLPQPFHACQVRYESDALRAVASSGCTPMPIYVDSSSKAPGEGVLVETFCPGRQLDFDHLRQGDLERCAAILADIHSVPVGPDTPLFRPHDPLQELFDECLERFRIYRASAFEDARITRWVDRLTALTSDAIDAAGQPPHEAHIVNTETLASHFLVGEGERAGWFVDWERPIIGEVAQDLAFFLAPTTTFWDSSFLFPKKDIGAFLTLYWDAVDGRFQPDAFDQRFSAWLKVSVLRAVAWCCKALIRYGGEGGHTTVKAAEKLPIYLSDEFLEMLLRECFF